MTGFLNSLPKTGLMNFPHPISRRSDGRQAPPLPLRDWFDQAGILICRPAPGASTGMAVALKGGHNAEHHNHNDVGSYVVALGQSTPLLDPGSEVYTARTFSRRRYESKVLNSYGHPVPRVAGQLQSEGRSSAARILQTEFTDHADTLVLDLTAAYKVNTLKSLQRKFVFSRKGNGRLMVTDEVRLTKPADFETALITFAPWEQESPNQLLIGNAPDRVRVRIDTNHIPFKVTVETIEEDLKTAEKPVRLAIMLQHPVKQAAVKLTITPAT